MRQRALGARADDVTGMVVRQGIRPALAGVALGLAISFAGARSVETLLYRVEPHDPVAVATATGVLLAVVLVATLLPARRAARVPAADALRAD